MPEPVDRSPASIPIEPAKGRMGCGVLLLGVAVGLAYLLVTRREYTAWLHVGALAQSVGGYFLVSVFHLALWLPLLVLAATGLRLLVQGASNRNYEEAACRRCRRTVVARKRHFGLLCPHDDYGHYARIYWAEVIAAVIVLGSAAVLTYMALREYGPL